MELQTVTPPAQHAFRESLRWATQDNHRRLDVLFQDVTDPACTHAYEAFVRMNHACHEAIEPLLEASALASHVAFDHRRREALRADLEAMGLEPLALAPFPLPTPTLHEAAGIAYVLEGSRLGAAFIVRRLDEAASRGLGDRPRRYLAESAHAGEFRQLMKTLSAFGWDDQSLQDAVRGARETFDYFHRAARRARASER